MAGEEAKLKTGRVEVVKPFNLMLDGKVERIEPGIQELPVEGGIGAYVLAHSKNPPKTEPPVGTPEYRAIQEKKKAQKEIFEAAVAEHAQEQMRQGKRR